MPAAKRNRKDAEKKRAELDLMVKQLNSQPARFATYQDAQDRKNPIYFGGVGYEEAGWEESFLPTTTKRKKISLFKIPTNAAP